MSVASRQADGAFERLVDSLPATEMKPAMETVARNHWKTVRLAHQGANKFISALVEGGYY